MSGDGRIHQLSLAALRMAASASFEDAGVLARWLYRFGTVPRGPAIERDFGPDDDPMAVLGMTRGGRTRRRLEADYEASSLTGWYSFARVVSPPLYAPACKLYISPRPEALAEAFPCIATVLADAEVRSFKVGRGAEGLLRSDKIVAYFDEPAHLSAVAAALARSLQGCPVQGVPFTNEAGGNGLLSIGIDPPAGSAAVSWRSWVTKRLAASLLARHAGAPRQRVVAVLDDLRLTGVDPECWHPHDHAFCYGAKG